MSSVFKSTRTFAACGLAIVGALIGAQAVSAHHSASMFDSSKSLALTGTVEEVRWTNPHVTLLVDGTVDGEAVREWSRSGWGYLIQAGMMLTPKLEIVARWDQLDATF